MSAQQILEQIAELSRTMAQHAAQGDWDALIAVQHEQQRLCDAMVKSDALRDIAKQPACQEQIRAILACHEKVASHVGPWMEQVTPLLRILNSGA